MTNKTIKIQDFADFILFRRKDCETTHFLSTAEQIRTSCNWSAKLKYFELYTDHIYGWTGGDKLPVPDGVKLRIFTASSACGRNQPNRHHEDGYINNWMNIVLDGVSIITAFQVLGIDDDYVLEGME